MIETMYKQIKIKMLNLVLIVSLFCTIMCGCQNNFCDSNITDKMLKYMNTKYAGDEFSFRSSIGGGVGATYKSIIVSSPNYPNHDIYVRYRTENGEEIFSDNYLGIKYFEQTEELLHEIMQNTFDDEYRLFYQPDNFACPNDDGMMPFEEYITDPNSCIGFTVIIKGATGDRDALANAIETAISKKELCCYGTIYFDASIDQLNELTRENLSSYLFQKSFEAIFSFDMKNGSDFSYQWK